MTIASLATDGTIWGRAEISPSDKSDASYATTASYYFRGSYDAATGAIALQGYQWIEHPEEDGLAWVFVALEGTVVGDAIVGSSDRGVWSMGAGDASDEVVDGLLMYDAEGQGGDG